MRFNNKNNNNNKSGFKLPLAGLITFLLFIGYFMSNAAQTNDEKTELQSIATAYDTNYLASKYVKQHLNKPHVMLLSGAIDDTKAYFFGGILISICEAQKSAGRSPEVIIYVDSGGGSVEASNRIKDSIKFAQEYYGAKIIVFMYKAYSAGYFSFIRADHIIASSAAVESTIGSLNCFFEYFNFNQLLENLGIKYNLFAGSDEKVPFSSFAKEDIDKQKERAAKTIEQILNLIKKDLIAYRSVSEENLEEILSGELFSSEQALNYNLCNEIRSLTEFEDILRKRGYDAGAVVTDGKFIGYFTTIAAGINAAGANDLFFKDSLPCRDNKS